MRCRAKYLGETLSSRIYSKLFAGGQRLGRFLWVRNSYSAVRRMQQTLGLCRIQSTDFATDPPVLLESSLSDLIAATRRDAVAFGIYLEQDIADQIYDFAAQAECVEPGYPHPFFIYELDTNGQLPDGHCPVRALIRDPMTCPILQQLSSHYTLLNLAQGYLNYFPSRISCHLTWSLATKLPIQEVMKLYPPTTFHYDIAGYNFATAYFYITPVLDQNSGSHELIRGSHLNKPLWMLLKSGRNDEADLYRYYDKSQAIEVLGDKGFGFFQDPSCFHRLHPPTRHHRLLLQFRYA